RVTPACPAVPQGDPDIDVCHESEAPDDDPRGSCKARRRDELAAHPAAAEAETDPQRPPAGVRPGEQPEVPLQVVRCGSWLPYGGERVHSAASGVLAR